MLYKLSAVGFVIHGTLGWMPLGTQEEHEKQVLASASAQTRLTHRGLGRVGAAGTVRS